MYVPPQTQSVIVLVGVASNVVVWKVQPSPCLGFRVGSGALSTISYIATGVGSGIGCGRAVTLKSIADSPARHLKRYMMKS